MMQGHLFESPISVGIDRAMRSPVSATADPDTSHQAAKEITASGQREGQCLGVLALVKRYPDCTAFELSVKGRTYDRYIIGRRLSELEHGKLIRKSGTKVCGISGHKACIWQAL